MFEAIKSLFPKKRSVKPNIETLIHAYGAVLGEGNLGPRDVSELPASKDEIDAALIAAMSVTPDGPVREQLRTGYMLLADFQDFEGCAKIKRDVTDLMMMEMQVRLKSI